jgi:hypothetical protein
MHRKTLTAETTVVETELGSSPPSFRPGTRTAKATLGGPDAADYPDDPAHYSDNPAASRASERLR